MSGHQLKENISFIQKNPNLCNLSYSQISTICSETQHQEQQQNSWIRSPSNEITLKINQIFIHSNRSPKQEANRIIHFLIEQKKEHLILSGVGIGYIFLPNLLKSISSICIIEFDPFLLYTLLSYVKLQNINNATHLNILFIKNIDETQLEDILPFFQHKQAEDFLFYQHPPLFKVYPKQSYTLQLKLKDLIHKRLVNQATLIKFQDLWNKNYYLNLASITKGYSLKQLVEYLKPRIRQSVLVSAGPSLSKDLLILQKYQSSLLIICVDTAYIPLKKHNIQPDIIFCTDPQWLNHFYVHYKDVQDSIWILDPIVNYHISHYLEQHQAKIFYWNSTFLPDKAIQKIYGERGEIRHGGSVSTNAFDFCAQISQENVILLGQDLAYNKQMTHVRGAYLEDQEFFRGNRLHSIEIFSFEYLSNLPTIQIPGIRKDITVQTDTRMCIFLKWFQKSILLYKKQFPKLVFYNATQEGANIDGMINLSFQNTLELLQLSNQKTDSVFNFFQQKLEKKKTSHQLINHLITLIIDIEEIHNIYIKNLNLISQLNTQVNSIQTQQYLFQELDKNDFLIRKNEYANEIIGLGAQGTIIKLTEHQKNNDPIQNACFLYNGMSISCKSILLILKKVFHLLETTYSTK